MLKNDADEPRNPATRLLDSEDFGWIDGMEFRSRRRTGDLYAGRHRSTLLGGCTEFSDHRPYYPGDALRQLDWRLLAKRDRHFIKRYEDERTISTMILIDRSGSMGFQLSTESKFHHALRTAACLSRLLLGQRDPVGMASWNDRGGLIVKPRTTPSHFEALFENIGLLEPAGESHLSALVEKVTSLFQKRMRVILLSDAFMDITEMKAILQSLSVRGHELILGHVLAPEEIDFTFREGTRFVDLEEGDHFLEIDPVVYREAYLEQFNEFLDQLMSECTHHGCGYFRLSTGEPAGASLAAFLRRWNAGSLAPVLGADTGHPVSRTEARGGKR